MTELLEKSLERRRRLDLGQTDALRLIDGEGDGLPGLFLDEFAGRWLFSTSAAGLPAPVQKWARASGRPAYHKKLDRHEREAPRHLAGPALEEPFEVVEHGLRFGISFQSGYSQGLFLDQRDNRQRVRERTRPGDTVLNTFAYTGAFSVAAASGGALTTTLDLSQHYLDWARENFRRNQQDHERQHFCKGDTFHWLRRFARQGRLFTGIVLDPPTFSRDDRGRVFRAERDYGELVALASGCLAPSGWLLCTTNCRRLSRRAFTRIVAEAMPGPVDLVEHPMPPDFTGEPYLKTVVVSR